MMTLHQLQIEHRIWVQHNFPDQPPHQPLLGLAEEVGELSHAHLKMEQGIRGSDEEHIAEAKDAIGDIVIFLSSYCNAMGYDLAECVEAAWNEVKERDWRKHPQEGTGA